MLTPLKLEAVFWTAVIPLVCLNAYAAIAMKMDVNSKLPEKQRFSWWTRNNWQVARRFAEFYPDSVLPLIFRCSFWVTLATGAMFLIFRLSSN